MKPQSMLKDVFGFDHFRNGQEEVVDSILKDHSTLAIFPTGAGKSMCYQLPALMMEGLTLVVSPLMALMKDQVDFLKSKGVLAEKLDSSLSRDEDKEVKDKVRANRIKILFVSPEKFNNEMFRNLMDDVKISLFVIDEAHCISEWGHNFRPDYLKLAKYAKDFKVQKVLCLTATANLSVEKDILDKFKIQAEHNFRQSAYRSNLNLNVLSVSVQNKKNKLLELIPQKTKSTIVYVTLQKTAKEVTDFLRSNQIKAHCYHAGLENEERVNIQNEFMTTTDSVIVATIAFGMGIDKSDIRNVIHYNLPKSIESYYQEIGRAGRDGEKSDCLLLMSADDIPTLESFAIGDFPEPDLVESLLKEICSQNDEFTLKMMSFAKEHDMSQLVAKTIFVQLELMGQIQALTPVYSEAKFKYIKNQSDIIKMFPPEKQIFLKRFFSHVLEKKVWNYIDIDDMTTKMNIERRLVMDTLDFLSGHSLIDLRQSGLVNRFRFINKDETLKNEERLIKEICETTQGRLQKQIERIGEFVSFFTKDGCIHSSIANYFETPLKKACGHCSYCENGRSISLAKSEYSLETLNLGDVKRDISEHSHVVKSSSRMTKFLLGIRTPYLTKNKLVKSKYFSYYEGKPWKQVNQYVLENF